MRPTSNNFNIEGIDNNNRVNPGPLVYLSNEATTEFTFFQNQFPPEYGHAAGGQFNSTVRTGTNQAHGSLYWYLQNRNLNALDQAFARQGVQENNDLGGFDQNRVGAAVGLPVIPNKMFFFGNFEYIPLGVTGFQASPILAPTAAGYNILSGLGGVSQTNLGVLQNNVGFADTPTTSFNFNGTQVPLGLISTNTKRWQNQYIGTGSMDFNFANSDQLRARYVHNELDSNNAGAALPAFFSNQNQRSLLANVSWYHNFSPLVVNELRLGYNRFQRNVGIPNVTFPGQSFFPAISIEESNLQLGPNPAMYPAANNSYQLADNVHWNIGRHTVRFGFDARRYIGPLTLSPFGNGSYVYSNLNTFLRDVSPDISGQRSFGNLTYSGDQWAWYGYVNDSWQLSPNFNLNLGVRYEYVTIPDTLRQQAFNSIASVPGLIEFNEPRTQKKNFAPRVGIAWSPDAARSSVFRAGFGMNYDALYGSVVLPSVPPGNVFTRFVNVVTPVFGFFGTGALVQPTAFNVFEPAVTAEEARQRTNSFVPDQKLPYSMQWNASWQQAIFNRFSIEARYVGVRGRHIPTQEVLNSSGVSATQNLPVYFTQPSQATLNGLQFNTNNVFTGANNQYAAAGFTNPITSINAGGNSWYHGLTAELRHRFSGGFQLQGGYTWSHLIDDLSGPIQTASGSFIEQRVSRDTSIYDRRHRATMTALWDTGALGGDGFSVVRDIFANMTIAGTYTYQSAPSILLNSGFDTTGGTSSFSGVFVNPDATGTTGTGVSPLRNSAGQTVAYLANDPNARFVRGAAGTFATGRARLGGFQDTNNFDVSAVKRFGVRDRFGIELRGDAYNVFNHPQYTFGQVNNIGFGMNSLARSFFIPGTSLFGNVTSVLPSNARTLQVALRFLF
jgi:hypothetical protein